MNFRAVFVCVILRILRVDHPCAGNIAFLVQEIEISGRLLDAQFLNLVWLAALFSASCHLRAGNVTLLVDVIEESFFAFDTALLNFLGHL